MEADLDIRNPSGARLAVCFDRDTGESNGRDLDL